VTDNYGMSEGQAGPASEILRAMGAGNPAAAEELIPLLYDELRRLARAHLSREGEAQTLQPTALVHEAFVRLVGDPDARFGSRQHFFGAAALTMRRILVDRARARQRLKRGGGAQREEDALDALAASLEHSDDEVLGLEEALGRLAQADARKSEVVHLRYFLGLSVEETAEALSISPTTVKSDWTFARAWLRREIDRGAQEADRRP
jgi:RNA polymerase sigma factor (TIGR02999 family)